MIEERRDRQRESAEDRLTAVLELAAQAHRERRWLDLLTHADDARRISGEVVGERRYAMIASRRVFDGRVLRDVREQAVRDPEQQARAAALLRWIGPEGLEAMIDGIVQSEAVAPVRFLHDALADEPGAFSMLLPLLSSSRAYVVRHGAELLGRHGDARAVAHLALHVDHPSGAVRDAVARALAGLDDPAVPDLLRGMLASPAAGSRVSAARAIAEYAHRPLLAALVRAFNLEQESAVRQELAAAIARIGGADSLVNVALDRRGWLRWHGRPVEQRLDAVSGLVAASTPETKRLLARLARAGDTPVRDAADRALSVRRRADGSDD